MYLSSCFIGRLIIGYYYLVWMNLIIFYEVLTVITGVVLSFLNDEIGRDWYFFYNNCLPESFYIKCWVLRNYICILLLKTLAVCGRLLSTTTPTKCWFWNFYCLFIIDFDDWRLKFVPVLDINLNVLFDYLSYTRDPYLDIPLELGRFPPNRSADGTLLKPTIGLFNFYVTFYYLYFIYWITCSAF